MPIPGLIAMAANIGGIGVHGYAEALREGELVHQVCWNLLPEFTCTFVASM